LALRRELLSGEVREGRRFGIVGLEHAEQLGDLHQIDNLLLQVHEFHLAASLPDAGIASDQLAESRTVDVADLAEIQDDVLAAPESTSRKEAADAASAGDG
jgi:hypothetical protein